MSNKKRISKKILELQKRSDNIGLQATVHSLKIMGSHANHMYDAFKYFTAWNLSSRKTKSFVVEFEKPLEIECGIDLGSFRWMRKSIADKLPAKYLNDFIKMVDVGFSEKDAFETLQETYKF